MAPFSGLDLRQNNESRHAIGITYIYTSYVNKVAEKIVFCHSCKTIKNVVYTSVTPKRQFVL